MLSEQDGRVILREAEKLLPPVVCGSQRCARDVYDQSWSHRVVLATKLPDYAVSQLALDLETLTLVHDDAWGVTTSAPLSEDGSFERLTALMAERERDAAHALDSAPAVVAALGDVVGRDPRLSTEYSGLHVYVKFSMTRVRGSSDVCTCKVHSRGGVITLHNGGRYLPVDETLNDELSPSPRLLLASETAWTPTRYALSKDWVRCHRGRREKPLPPRMRYRAAALCQVGEALRRRGVHPKVTCNSNSIMLRVGNVAVDVDLNNMEQWRYRVLRHTALTQRFLITPRGTAELVKTVLARLGHA